MIKTFECCVCRSSFSKNIFPSDKNPDRKFCSRSCQMKSTRGNRQTGIVFHPCEECGNPINKYSRASRPHRFCSKSCASRNCCKRGLNVFSGIESRLANGKVTLDALEIEKKNRSIVSSERNAGRTLSSETREKISKSCVGIPNVLKGKTFEEFYGKEKASALSKHHSEKLKEGFRSGKIKPSARTRIAPTYKGIRLRSKLEHAVILSLENVGLFLNEALIYEDSRTIVQWTDSSGKQHSYTPDLHDIVNEIVYEIKPTWLIDAPSDEMERKMQALVDAGFTCAYISDKKVRSQC